MAERFRRDAWSGGREGLHLWCESWPERQFFAERENVLGRAVARRRDETWISRRDPE
jgi:hypothetical protein